MRKVLLLMMVSWCLMVSGQTMIRRQAICKVNYGNSVLEQAIEGNDTAYAMLVATGKKVFPHIVVDLGDREKAIHYLKYLLEVDLQNDDAVMMENSTDNVVTRGLFGSLRFHSEGRQFHGDIIKKYLAVFLEALQPSADGKAKKKSPAYMRNRDDD